MKVLIFTSLFPNHLQPNSAVFIKQRMSHFAKLKNCEIKVVAPVPYCPQWPFLGKYYLYSQIKPTEVMEGIEIYHPRYIVIPKISMIFHAFSMFFATVLLVKKIKKDFDFDLIDGHYIYPDGLAAVLSGKLFDVPVVLSARGSDINLFIKFRFIKPMIKFALRHADHVISVCDALKQQMVSLGIQEKKISVIPNGIDPNSFYQLSKSESRQYLSIPVNEKVILSVGSLIPLKGFHILLEAFVQVLQIDTQVQLYIVGKGLYRKALETIITELSLERNVTLVGEVPNKKLCAWYSAADVFCLASSSEGWANVIMESLACGTPVVSTNVSGAPEIITTPDVGLLVDRTPESISQGIITALRYDWDRGLIEKHISSRTWDVVAREVYDIFSNLKTTAGNSAR